MAIEIRKVNDHYGIYNGYNSEFLRWQDLWIDEKDFKNYIKENPFPKDNQYSLDDFLHKNFGVRTCNIIILCYILVSDKA